MADTTLSAGVNQLRKNSVGVWAVTFLFSSAAAPLAGVAGGVPISILLGKGATLRVSQNLGARADLARRFREWRETATLFRFRVSINVAN